MKDNKEIIKKSEGEQRTITFEEVEERLKNVNLENMTAQDVLDRYIAYGSDEELNNPEIQKLFIKYDYIDELINLVQGVITDTEVIESILSSEIFNDNNLIIKKGRIQEIAMVEDSKLPEEVCWMNITFLDIDKSTNILKDMYFKRVREYEYDIDKYKEIMKYQDQELTAIIEKKEKELRLKCFLFEN